MFQNGTEKERTKEREVSDVYTVLESADVVDFFRLCWR